MISISRYSIENFLCDPIVIYACLLDNEAAPLISGLDLHKGDEAKIRVLQSTLLQRIADTIVANLDSLGPDADLPSNGRAATSATIHYNSGSKIKVPSWILNKRGHDLAKEVHEKWNNCHRGRLEYTFFRLRMIPQDLIDTLIQIVNQE